MPLRQLLRTSRLRNRVLIGLGAELRDLLFHGAREEHASGLRHELLLLTLILVQDALQERAVRNLVPSDQGRKIVSA